MVIGHVYENPAVYMFLYSFHLPIFFFASGYTHKGRSPKDDLAHKIQTIVVPYFFFGLLELIYWQVFERRFRPSDLTFLQALLGLLLGEYRLLDFNVHMWYLPCFFMCSILLNFLSTRRSNKPLIIATILLTMLFILLPLPISGWPVWKNSSGWLGLPDLPWGLDRVPKYFLFLIIGYLLRQKVGDQKITSAFKKITSVILATIAIAATFLIAQICANASGILWYLAALIGVFASCVLAYHLRRLKPFQYLGKISLVVLCTHGPIYRVISKLLSAVMHSSSDVVRSNFGYVLLIALSTLFLSSIIYEILNKIIPWSIGKRKVIAKTV